MLAGRSGTKRGLCDPVASVPPFILVVVARTSTPNKRGLLRPTHLPHAPNGSRAANGQCEADVLVLDHFEANGEGGPRGRGEGEKE